MDTEFRCGGCWELKNVAAASGWRTSSGRLMCKHCAEKFALRVARKDRPAKSTGKVTELLKSNPDEYLRRIMKRSRKGDE